jgi:hypothetical protein
MNLCLTDHVRDRLVLYEAAIAEIEAHPDGPGGTGEYRAGPAYGEKHRIAALIAKAGDRSEMTELRKRYDRLTARLSSLEERRGRELRQKLLCELRYSVDSWHAALCHANLCTMVAGEVAEISRREVIGVLLEELAGEYDLSGIGQMVGMLDETAREMTRHATCDSMTFCPEKNAGPGQLVPPVDNEDVVMNTG